MAETVLEWEFPPGTDHRIQAAKKPGSAHWSITKDTRENGGDWERAWGREAIRKPAFGRDTDE